MDFLIADTFTDMHTFSRRLRSGCQARELNSAYLFLAANGCA